MTNIDDDTQLTLHKGMNPSIQVFAGLTSIA